MIDHLFRHQYGKMVSIFTRIFGLHHLEIIEDAIQDTFITSMKSWQKSIPDNPEAWLMQAAKYRILDLLRKISAEDQRIKKIQSGIDTYVIHELFLDHEVDDSILRMIFTACNPKLNAKDQIAFALKTISGFSGKEIAATLLLKEETVKKRLTRAKKAIKKNQIDFKIPQGERLKERLKSVLEVIYLIFNEGFHSIRKDRVIREDLCGEAIRLSKCLLKKPITATAESHALFALLCFQASRLKSKINDKGELISLRNQDRSLWYQPLIEIGHQSMQKAMDTEVLSAYHYEAAIAAEHLQAKSYDATNWEKIGKWYKRLTELESSPFHHLNLAIVQLEQKNFPAAKASLESIAPKNLEQSVYLYYGTYAEYELVANNSTKAINYIDKAISNIDNEVIKEYLLKRKKQYLKELKK